MTEVLLTGEAMGLFIAEEIGEFEKVNHFSKGIAGAEINVSIGLSRLDFDVEYITKLGDDPFGHYITNHLRNEKIGTSHLIVDSINKTGLQLKEKVEQGDPAVAYYRKNSAYSTLTKEDVEAIDFSKVKLFYMTGIPLALNESTREVVYYLVEKARVNDCLVTFDPNLRPSLWEDKETMVQVINKAASYADIIMPGIGEGIQLTGKQSVKEIANFYLDKGIATVIIKDGNNGAYFKEKNKELKHVSGYEVKKIIDTVGAGDGFAVGVISGVLDNLTIEESVKRGNAIGAIQVQHKSDNEALPRRNELSHYMNN